ncbi:MAG: hypothetical protein J7J20_06585 [Desulfurococcales archaeon]|nr:hypothetical protein [Desulfurococcales archaeon]
MVTDDVGGKGGVAGWTGPAVAAAVVTVSLTGCMVGCSHRIATTAARMIAISASTPAYLDKNPRGSFTSSSRP